MKKLKLLATCLLFCLLANNLAAQLQQIKIVNFTVKNALPANIDSWTSIPGALVLTAQKSPGTQVREPMMILQIRSGSAIICGNTMATAKRVDPFDVRVFTSTELTGLLGNCRELKAGAYSICVQFFNIDKVAISQEVCKEFKVEDAAVDYAPPTLITPDEKKKFLPNELQQPVTFRWTPLVPKPREPVTYRLRVWQLMQGQNGVAAMKSNTPLIDKDIKEITQATVSGINTGPCKPPYLCDFIWNVQAVNREGKPIGRNNGMSESWSFGATSPTGIIAPQNVLPENNKRYTDEEAKQPITFRWTPIVPKPQEPVTYRLKVWQLMQGQNSTEAMRSNQPIVTKDVDNITEATISGIYTGPCKPPYLCDFVWNVQALEREGKPLGSNEGKSAEWSFGATSPSGITTPQNVLPENNKRYTDSEVKQPITFRWTPLVPKPQEPVTYRLKVWQLMQGQSGAQAMRSNPPIVTKDVDNITEAIVSGIYTGPCRPPYLCDYVWNVQALTRDGKPIGENEGTSEMWAFKITDKQAGLTKPPTNISPENGIQFKKSDEDAKLKELSFEKGRTFRWTPVVPKPQEPVTYRLKVWQLMQGQSGAQAMRSNPPIVTKDVADITEATVSGIYTGPCRPPYLCDYVWNVQALTRDGKPVGENEGTSEMWAFKITDKQAGLTKPPTNIFPENGTQFKKSDEDAKLKELSFEKGRTFRWTPVVPKPQEPVTYRLRVWQLMQGQNSTEAMRSNPPIVTKDVDNITEALVTGVYTGPCRPPYLCDYVWQVQALNKEGKPIGANEGKSEAFRFTFKITEENSKGITNQFPEDKKVLKPDDAKAITFRWTPLVPKPQEPVTYRLKVWQLMQGQSGAQAMRSNPPIVTKDVDNITETTVSGIYTGPCRPPYLCDFVWVVEALSGEAGSPGISKKFTFKIIQK